MAADDPANPLWEGIYLQRSALSVVPWPGIDEMRRNMLDNRLASGKLSRKVFKVVYITSRP